MVRKKNRRQKFKARQGQTSHISIVRDSDNVYDEVDKFNMEYDESILKLVKKPKKPLAKEVLRVAEDDEFTDNEIMEEEDEAGASDKDYKISTNKWGKRRQNYYGTSYVDKDIGTINDSEEEEILQLEEEDALARQQKLEQANSHIDYDQFFQNTTKEMNDGGEQRELADILQIRIGTIENGKKEEETGNSVGEVKEEDYDECSDSDGEQEEETEIEPRRERRGITYEIRKNKGIPKDKGRRKGKQHSRVMKRRQYQKALIKRRSQVPDVRKEITKYDGEKRGIRISTIRSIKL